MEGAQVTGAGMLVSVGDPDFTRQLRRGERARLAEQSEQNDSQLIREAGCLAR